MCNATNCSHDLNDSLEDLFGAFDAAQPVDTTLADAQLANTRRFEETCPACRGSGVFRSYSGRVVGDCFKCKGKGKQLFRTSNDDRAKAREAADARKAKAAAAVAEQAAAWLEANPVEAEWLRQPVTGDFTFHADMLAALVKYGSLTERQEAAVRNAAAKSAARKAQWAAERADRDANKAVVEISRIADAFASAKGAGLRFPKLRLDTFTFSLAPATGRNAGSVYVKDGETYLGKIADGRFTRSRDCDDAVEARIVVACADPAAAAEAYGQRTGQCACCGRELTAAESIARSIGPVCLEKWGW